MTTLPMYLRQEAQIDPLIHDWYAWVHIVPPVAAAFNVIERQIKAMKSFIQSPDLHVEALKTPHMRGGPFIDLPPSAVPAVRELLQRMTHTTARQMEFVQSVRVLDELLESKADGWCLQPLYPDIPAPLRGRIELVYDRHHRPDFRIFESLFYRSPLYDETAQSIALSPFRGDASRPFIFSTPRLDTEGTVKLRLPFRSPLLDELFASRDTGCDLPALERRLDVDAADHEAFIALFTEHPPEKHRVHDGVEPRISYIGHACILVECNGASALIDPLIPCPSPANDVPRLSFADLPERIDHVLITHGHHDHIMLETLLQLRHKIGTVVVGKNSQGNILDPSLKLMLNELGFARVVEIGEFERVELPVGEVTALPFMGEHHDLDVQSRLCYHLRAGSKSVLFAADSCNFDHGVYERAHDILGDVDALFIGMECDGAPVSWVYGPTFTKKPERERDRSRRGRGSDSREAMALVERLNCFNVYVYAMGSEPWLQYVLDVHYTPESNPIVHAGRLVEACLDKGIHAERLHGAKQIYLGPSDGAPHDGNPTSPSHPSPWTS